MMAGLTEEIAERELVKGVLRRRLDRLQLQSAPDELALEELFNWIADNFERKRCSGLSAPPGKSTERCQLLTLHSGDCFFPSETRRAKGL